MKLRAPLLWMTGVVLAAALLHGQSEKGDYTQANLGHVSQSTPRRHREGPVYSVPAYPLYRPQLAPGEGRDLVEAYCNTCHSTIYITMQPPLPAATWEAEVNKMIRTFGQPIPGDVVPKIIRYLQAHYTPETRKSPTLAPRAARQGPSGSPKHAPKKPTSPHP